MKTIAVTTEASDLITIVFFEEDNIASPELTISATYENLKAMLLEGVNTMNKDWISATTTIKVQQPT